MSEPPPFANAANCKDCGSGFSLIKRKHHCRNCGGTVCDKCSSKTARIPAFNYGEAVRVCEACHVKLSSAPSKAAAADPKAEAKKSQPEVKEAPAPARPQKDCTCGMPLCICPDPEEDKPADAPKEDKPEPKAETAAQPKPAATTTFATPSTTFFSGFGGPSATKWDLKGNLNEQCRDAIKGKDAAGVKLLLDAGANAKYTDGLGNGLVHLAAMFDLFEVVKMLVAKGADVRAANPAGETALDLALPALRRKMETAFPPA